MPETPACSTEQMISESQDELLAARVKLMSVKLDLALAAIESLPMKVEDALAAAYRRGLVNGAQRLAVASRPQPQGVDDADT